MQPKQQMSSDRRSQTLWRIDRSTSVVKFSVKKLLLLTVEGRFTDVEGSIVFDEQDLSASKVQATLVTASVDTGNSKRDEHLRSKSFLDADSYPKIEFVSSDVRRGTDRDTFVVTGALNIKGTSRDVVLKVTEIDRSKSPDGTEVVYYLAESQLNRRDFNISAWPGVIGKSLKVTIDVQANRERS